MPKYALNTVLILSNTLQLLKEVSTELEEAEHIAMRDKVDQMIAELEEFGVE